MARAELEKTYNPSDYEDKIYGFWLSQNLFHSEPDKDKKPFTIVIPPPNVTDKLHIGHALNNTLQDILIRWKRLEGYNVEWLPGVDHAGIATQVKVEQMLYERGIEREKLGRDKFLEYVWDWKDKHGNEIIDQLKKLGSSCDWDREHFTMDSDLSRAVREAFVRLYKEGLIYRDKYMVNWCPRCHTAIADEEVEYKEEKGALYYVRYPIKDSKEYLTVATTRPETMYGDTAVAVNPNDKRYAEYIGRKVILPLVNREIPIIGDEYVDMEFGTGALKITPAHDPNDFQIGKKHSLETIIAIDSRGKMNETAGDLKGMSREEAREKTVERLEREGYLEKKESYVHSVGHCYRCKTDIEPYISTQWFVKMKPLAKPAIEAVKSGKIRFTPEHWTKVYLHWMENIQDWCISRQLWWGHQIPVFYCQDCGEEIVETENPAKCPKCGSTNLKRDPDVLDTWFSSWLWPFSTFGWPKSTEDLSYYYPTDVLATASEIIFFWVARMIMAGEKFVGDIPFHDVYIHGTVRDKNGVKMSKSLGNGIDPRDIIEKYGADALRFSIIAVSGKGQDPHIGYNTFEIGRNFANKVWNIARFILLRDVDSSKIKMNELSEVDIWIMGEFNAVVERYEEKMKGFEFQEVAMDVYDFIWHKLADWYIEYVKNVNSENGFNVALSVFERALLLLHPFMPFVTEVIYQKIYGENSSLLRNSFPEKYEVNGTEDVGTIWEIIKVVRNMKSEMGIDIKKSIDLLIISESPIEEGTKSLIEETVKGFLNLSSIKITSAKGETKRAICTPVGAYEICLPVSENIDIEEQSKKFEKEIKSLEKEIAKADRQLSNSSFVKKAPESVVNSLREKRIKYGEKLEKLERYLKIFKENF